MEDITIGVGLDLSEFDSAVDTMSKKMSDAFGKRNKNLLGNLGNFGDVKKQIAGLEQNTDLLKASVAEFKDELRSLNLPADLTGDIKRLKMELSDIADLERSADTVKNADFFGFAKNKSLNQMHNELAKNKNDLIALENEYAKTNAEYGKYLNRQSAGLKMSNKEIAKMQELENTLSQLNAERLKAKDKLENYDAKNVMAARVEELIKEAPKSLGITESTRMSEKVFANIYDYINKTRSAISKELVPLREVEKEQNSINLAMQENENQIQQNVAQVSQLREEWNKNLEDIINGFEKIANNPTKNSRQDLLDLSPFIESLHDAGMMSDELYLKLEKIMYPPSDKHLVDYFQKLADFSNKAADAIGKLLKKMYAFTKSAIQKGIKLVSKHFGEVEKSAKNGKTATEKLTFAIKKFIMAGIGIRSIYFLFRKFWNMVREGVKVMAQLDDETNHALSSIKTATNTLQNQLGSMMSELINGLYPILVKIIQAITVLVDKITQVFAAIRGQSTYKKAANVWKDYRSELDKSSKSAKDLADNLSGLDEIHKWNENNDSGSDGITGGELITTPIEEELSDLAKRIKEIFEQLVNPIKKAWASMGNFVVTAWKKAIQEVWGLLKDMGNDFLIMWNQEATVKMWKDIFKIVGDVGLVIKNLAKNLRIAWNENKTGLHIWEAIRDIVATIISHIRNMADATVKLSLNLDFRPLLKNLQLLLESINKVTDFVWSNIEYLWNNVLLPFVKWCTEIGIPELIGVFTEFNSKVDWTGITQHLQNIWNAIEPFAERVGEGLIYFVQTLTDHIANFVNSDVFKSFLDSIADALNKVDQEKINKIADALAGFIEMILGVSAKLLTDVIESGVFQKLFDLLIDFFANMNEGKINAIAHAIEGLVIAFLTFKTIAGVATLVNGISKVIKVLTSPTVINALLRLGEIVTQVGSVIISFIEGFITYITPFISKILVFLKSTAGGIAILVSGIIIALSNFIDMLKTGFSWVKEIAMIIGIALAAVGAIIAGVTGGIAIAIAAIVAVVLTAIVLVKEHWTEICEWFKKTWQSLKDGWNSFWQGIHDKVVEIWTNIKTKWHEFWNNIAEGLKSKGDSIKTKWQELWTSIKTKVSEIWTNIKTGIYEKITGVKETISSVLSSIREVWSNMWNGMKNTVISVFQNIWSGIKTIINSILGGVEGMANGVIRGLNAAIGAINNLRVSIPSWIPYYGGRTIGFNIPTLGQISIPKLAEGAVLPANQPFLAMLGDQKQGNNLEAPESLIRKIVREETGGTNGGNYTFVAQLDGRTIFKEVISQAKLRQMSSGVNAFEL